MAYEMYQSNQPSWVKQAESTVSALNWLYRRHYWKHDLPQPYRAELPSQIDNPLRELSERVYRRCSNHRRCPAVERPNHRFGLVCKKCQITIYCCEQCLNQHRSDHYPLCSFLTRQLGEKPIVVHIQAEDKQRKRRRFKRADTVDLSPSFPMKLRSTNKQRRSSHPTIR